MKYHWATIFLKKIHVRTAIVLKKPFFSATDFQQNAGEISDFLKKPLFLLSDF
jgi:hypothetical protein